MVGWSGLATDRFAFLHEVMFFASASAHLLQCGPGCLCFTILIELVESRIGCYYTAVIISGSSNSVVTEVESLVLSIWCFIVLFIWRRK